MQFKNLRRLNLRNNKLSEIPKHIIKLNKLQEISLSQNQIKHIDKEFIGLAKLKSLDLTTNKIRAPREALRGRGIDVIQYILDFQDAKNKKPLHEAKLIFIGSGDTGKTSLIKMITKKRFNSSENKTDGIEITDWSVKRDKNKIKVHIWDFGGQEIMHATHKFFMTSRSVYVLVVNPRTQDNYGNSEIEYWLKLVRSYAGDVPVIVAVNKCEVHKANIAKGQITDKYDNVLGFIETSCSKNIGINDLKTTIANAIGKLEFIDDELPQSYFDIKLKLEETNKEYIEFEEYEEICKEVDPNFKKSSKIALVRLLHDLGVMLNFSDNRVLRNTQVLNPEWVTKGVYQIINYPKLIENKGILSLSDLPEILDQDQYPTEKERLYITDIMGHFELSFQMEGKQDLYFVPGTFPKDKPDINWTHATESSLKFQFQYDILPSSIISRFIVKSHRLIRENNFWLNGVVLAHENCEALIVTDPQERTIKIEVSGNGDKRAFLAVIREKFEEVHTSYQDIDIQRYISIDPEGIILVNYNDLLAHEEANEDYIFIPKLKTRFNVKTLLNGIEREKTRNSKPIEMEHEIKGASVFISYSHKDENLKDKLKAHLSTLKRKNIIDIWDDRNIIPGKDFDKEISHYLTTSDIILLLISSDFINSDYCYSTEMNNAVIRHESGEAVVIPIILRSCDWTDTPFRKLQGLPKDGHPVTSWSNEDEAFTNVAQGIKKAIESFLKL
ncbi:COR domain-containing protein [Hymenobacter sp. 102]|uniref:COR domain-containing protein n=1 Tax=Hymenobacter sp. 102 TaxID=3403152 RepID=UPI003CE9E892